MGVKAQLIGMKFGAWSVAEAAPSIQGNSVWKCICDCGNTGLIRGNDLKRGLSTSCGCLKSEKISKAKTIHGLSEHPIYSSWKSMRNRCESPKAEGYELYGGRGIKVCARWQTFELFFADMLPTWADGLSIDRIETDGNYEPDNCKWSTPQEQARNRRTNHIIETPSGPMLVIEAAEKYGLNQQTIHARLRYGWTDPHELVKPVMDKTEYLKQYRS